MEREAFRALTCRSCLESCYVRVDGRHWTCPNCGRTNPTPTERTDPPAQFSAWALTTTLTEREARDRTRPSLARNVPVIALALLLLAGVATYALKVSSENTPTRATVLGTKTTRPARPASVTTPSPTTASPEPVVVVEASVVRVVDGDTAVLQVPGRGSVRVRLIGIDAPEITTRPEPFGLDAAQTVRRYLTSGKMVYLETDVDEYDDYGRLLAYVWLARPMSGSEARVRSDMLNALMLSKGLARLMTIPPDVKYVGIFRSLQSEAQADRAGMWA